MLRFSAILLIALGSGAAALSHELLWTRRLIDLMGATSWVTGRVLGVFFLGLALGSWLASRWPASKHDPLRLIAVVELIIAILVLPTAFLPAWTDWIWPAIGPDALASWVGSSIKLLLTMIVVLPPAIAMGMTLPFFVRAATESGGTVANRGIWVYSFNTLGGVLGLWLTTNLFLQRFGVLTTMLLVAGINLLVAVIAFVLHRQKVRQPNRGRHRRTPKKKQAIKSSRESVAADGELAHETLTLLAFCSGAIVLAFEVLAIRLIGLVVPSSFQSTSTLLANVILFLAIASLATYLLVRYVVSARLLLVAALAGATALIATCPLIAYQMTNELVSLRYLASLDGEIIASIGEYWLRVFGLVAVSAGAALVCMGIVFPAILTIRSETDPAGTSVGRLLAVNGLGGLVGSEFCNLVLVPTFGIYLGFAVLASLSAVLVLLASRIFRFRWGYGLLVGLIPFVLCGFFFNSSLPYLSPKSTKKYEIDEASFGRDGVLLVVTDQQNSRGIIMNNQYLLGSSNAAKVERRQLLLPWLLHPNPRHVCCIGLATGISAGGLESLRDPPSVTAIEISSMVVDAAKNQFEKENQRFFKRPENRVIIEDGRTYVASVRDEFDLIVGDLFRPHGVGEGRLYSVEHFRNVKQALKPGGVFCQWLPAHQLSQRHFESIASTFQTVFPETLIVNGSTLVQTPSIGLVGWRQESDLDSRQLMQRFKKIQTEPGVDDRLLEHAQLFVVGVLNNDAFHAAPINTLDNAFIEIAAGQFWTLKDLRKNRPLDSLENGFLSGRNWIDFNRLLLKKVTPVFDKQTNEQFIKLLEADLKKQGLKRAR